jgi:hypothetical protein
MNFLMNILSCNLRIILLKKFCEDKRQAPFGIYINYCIIDGEKIVAFFTTT